MVVSTILIALILTGMVVAIYRLGYMVGYNRGYEPYKQALEEQAGRQRSSYGPNKDMTQTEHIISLHNQMKEKHNNTTNKGGEMPKFQVTVRRQPSEQADVTVEVTAGDEQKAGEVVLGWARDGEVEFPANDTVSFFVVEVNEAPRDSDADEEPAEAGAISSDEMAMHSSKIFSCVQVGADVNNPRILTFPQIDNGETVEHGELQNIANLGVAEPMLAASEDGGAAMLIQRLR
jgi:hypothetical protein